MYLDPPHHPISESSSLTGYVQGGRDEGDQLRLRDVCNGLRDNGITKEQNNPTLLRRLLSPPPSIDDRSAKRTLRREES